jgi:hypothetical protein
MAKFIGIGTLPFDDYLSGKILRIEYLETSEWMVCAITQIAYFMGKVDCK